MTLRASLDEKRHRKVSAMWIVTTAPQVLAPVPVPKAQANGRLARHRKRANRGHSNTSRHASAYHRDYRGEAGHRGRGDRLQAKPCLFEIKYWSVASRRHFGIQTQKICSVIPVLRCLLKKYRDSQF